MSASAPVVAPLYPAIAEELRACLANLERGLQKSRNRPPPSACCAMTGAALLGLIVCLLMIVQFNVLLPLMCLCGLGCRLGRCRQPNLAQLQQQVATTLFHAELYTVPGDLPPTLGILPEPWDAETKRALAEDRQLCVRRSGPLPALQASPASPPFPLPPAA